MLDHNRVRGVMAMFLALVATALNAGPCLAHGPNDPPHQLYQIGDLKLSRISPDVEFMNRVTRRGNGRRSKAPVIC